MRFNSRLKVSEIIFTALDKEVRTDDFLLTVYRMAAAKRIDKVVG